MPKRRRVHCISDNTKAETFHTDESIHTGKGRPSLSREAASPIHLVPAEVLAHMLQWLEDGAIVSLQTVNRKWEQGTVAFLEDAISQQMDRQGWWPVRWESILYRRVGFLRLLQRMPSTFLDSISGLSFLVHRPQGRQWGLIADLIAATFADRALQGISIYTDSVENDCVLTLLGIRNLHRVLVDNRMESDQNGIPTLKALARYPQIDSLTLRCGDSLSRQWVAALARLSSLTALRLHLSNQFPPELFKEIADSLRLQSLKLEVDIIGSGEDPSGVEDLKNIGRMVSLTELDFPCMYYFTTPVEETVPRWINTLPQLRALRVESCAASINNLVELGPRSNLESLHLRFPRTPVHGQLRALNGAPSGLRKLSLSFVDFINDETLRALSSLHQLRALELFRCPDLSDEGMQILSPLKQLEELTLLHSQITDVSVERISRLGALRKLRLSRCTAITDVGVRHLMSLAKLQRLELDCCPLVTGSGFSEAHRFTALESLELSRCSQFSDIGAAYVTCIPNLRRLGLSGTAVTDAGMKLLPRLQHLEQLDLDGMINVSDAGVRHLTKLRWLESLWLLGTDTRVSDDTIRELLWRFPKLYQRLMLTGKRETVPVLRVTSRYRRSAPTFRASTVSLSDKTNDAVKI